MSTESCWQVRTYSDDHNNCFWDLTKKSINSTFLGKSLTETFVTYPKLGAKEFREDICRKFRCTVSKRGAYLAKKL
ncbi:hypothetical protein F511_25978 [Dorcoceras hygrometricum]|uniref:Uncharacterized protein n=1 Tax=Dorcoceras hygrometricum TaxID=472368 RepID=A0A2Z7C971_9LAMI|nr:hypothetical protein F511_25978 [Dorcoceras hygrometricum]